METAPGSVKVTVPPKDFRLQGVEILAVWTLTVAGLHWESGLSMQMEDSGLCHESERGKPEPAKLRLSSLR